MVFLEFEIKRNVVIPPDKLDPKSHLVFRKVIILRLLEDIARRKASKEHGYYVAVNTLESVGDSRVDDMTGNIIVPVSFTCTTVMLITGEVLLGTVEKIMRHGAMIKSGPVEGIFLPIKRMKDYKYTAGEEPSLVNEAQQSKIEKSAKVRYRVIGSKWLEDTREFQNLATIDDDYLGPI